MNIALIAGLCVFVLLFLFRMPISIDMILASIIYFMLNDISLGTVCNFIMNPYCTNHIFLAIPVFIFTANVMNNGQITGKLISFANTLTGNRKDSSGQINIVTSVFLSGLTGSEIADISTIGKMEIETMKKAGYEKKFACAVTATSTAIGAIFPPSIPLVLYATFAECSVGALFLGGVLPAILMTFALVMYVSLVSNRRNYPNPKKVSFKDFLSETIASAPALLTPCILLLGIYSDIMTPTEVGVITSVWVIIVSFFVYKVISLNGLLQIIKHTVRDIGSVCLLLSAASVVSHILVREQIAVGLVNFITQLSLTKTGFLITLNLIILLLGMCFGSSIIQLIFIPILIPVAANFGINEIHFGELITLNIMIGTATPPFGVLLYITSQISNTPFKDVVKESFLPIFCLLIVHLFVTFIPEISLFLPNLAGML